MTLNEQPAKKQDHGPLDSGRRTRASSCPPEVRITQNHSKSQVLQHRIHARRYKSTAHLQYPDGIAAVTGTYRRHRTKARAGPDRTQYEWRMNMFYITYVYDKTNTNEQLSFEDLFNADGSIKTLSVLPSTNAHTEYRTICTQFLLPRTQTFFDRQAQQFTNQFAEKLNFYADKDMHEFYTEFSIPKHSGGFRTINAPKEVFHFTLEPF